MITLVGLHQPKAAASTIKAADAPTVTTNTGGFGVQFDERF